MEGMLGTKHKGFQVIEGAACDGVEQLGPVLGALQRCIVIMNEPHASIASTRCIIAGIIACVV